MLACGAGCLVDDPRYLGPAHASGTTTATSGTSSTTDGLTTADGSRGSDSSGLDGTDTACPATDPAWWDGAWSHRRRLRFDNTAQAEDLQNFTVLVVLHRGDLGAAPLAPQGTDLRFVDDDGATLLPHHIERWDPTGDSSVWVRVPRIDGGSGDDHVWLYYGNPQARDVADPSGSYDDATVGVWHLEEDMGAPIDSATGISCTWAGTGTGSQQAQGAIASGVQLDGVVDHIDCGPDRIADTDHHTITAWVNLPLTGDDDQAVVSAEADSNPFRGIGLYVRRSDGALGKRINNAIQYGARPRSRVPPDTWSFVAIRGFRSPPRGTLEVSVDGGSWETIVSGNTNHLSIQDGTSLVLGAGPGAGPGSSTQGLLDEVSISSIERSDDWVRAQYLSSSDGFVTFEQSQPQCP